ncbi:unnamed protein product [Medioppia subpectinata]|uniref:V-type proton ATPase subunit a n=1 Tax=Medioppia subpectinata TaxID=1979941 RepID=A0A7R9L8P2_9ACAR|nr:unnamed protein product [Medioppia subpectinata]CAG2116546.1 unnamed protein product [Medioppia subpectinata]
MGSFSIYTGLMYNDIFSKSLNIFGSSWKAIKPSGNLYNHSHYILDPQTQYDGGPYFFGIDPVWQVSENKILFLNSYKMKLSVILGVGQMLFGVILSFWNHKYFQNRLNIMCEFIPQMIFLLSIFGYMNLLIVPVEHNVRIHTADDLLVVDLRGCAPSILINLINMFLYKYVDDDDDVPACYLKDWYAGQKFFQTILLLAALGCIPWMLFVKPYILKKQHELRERFHPGNEVMVDGEPAGDTTITIEPAAQSGGGDHGSGVAFDMQEIFIHQAIHTIEYCLGSISHTASYLRLWALSLAHAQLSEVLWSMVMRIGLNGTGISGGIVMYLIFGFWAGLTVSVLLVMEGLSAFLHALRLHWVEFQSKFYSGTGYSFQPFSFEVILEQTAQESAAETT